MPACPACSAQAASAPIETYREPIFGRTFEVFACPACGVAFSIVPGDFPLADWYRRADSFYGRLTWAMEAVPRDRDWRFLHFLEQIRARGVRGRLLDVGSGEGRFLSLAAERGWDGELVGLEFNPDMANRLKGRYRVVLASLDGFLAREPVGTYDVVTLFDVLEHLVEPGKALAGLARLLRPGGHLAVTVPNAERVRLFDRETFDYPPNHVTRWSSRSLADAARRSGFEVLDLRPSPMATKTLSSQLFYKLFGAWAGRAKRLVIGKQAGGEKAVEAGPRRGWLRACAGDPERRKKVELGLLRATNVLLFPVVLPLSLAVRVLRPRSSGDTLFLLARKAS